MVGKSPKLGTDPKMLNDLESNLHASPIKLEFRPKSI